MLEENDSLSDETNESKESDNKINNPLYRYAELFHKKRLLNEKVYQINKELADIQPKLYQKMEDDHMTVFSLTNLTAEDERVWGGKGSIEIKMANEFERITQESLARLSVLFFRTIMPDELTSELTLLGLGFTSWVWKNRTKCNKRNIKRIYTEDIETRKKKKIEHTEKLLLHEQVIKKPKIDNIPNTTEDFNAIKALQNLKSKVSHK
jgi:hypothetical protein